MEISEERKQMLDLMLRPAFCVKDGIICHINPAAKHLLLTQGQPISALLASGQEEYLDFNDCLQLQLRIGEQFMDVTVVRQDNIDLFFPNTVSTDEQLSILPLASMQLRQPLAGLTAILDRVLADADPMHAAQANRRLHQILRILSNMSDVQRFSRRDQSHMEYTEICGFLEEILEKADALLENIHIRICAQLPHVRIYTLLDREQIERALYNLLSNAAKYCPANSPIQVQLNQKGQRLYLSVTSQSCAQTPAGDFYHSFLREPSLEDPSRGLGLGLILVRCAAANHGGAVMIDRPDGGHIRVTMTMAIQHHTGNAVRSPVIPMDYTGERDHCLFELADVLPAELYRIDKT